MEGERGGPSVCADAELPASPSTLPYRGWWSLSHPIHGQISYKYDLALLVFLLLFYEEDATVYVRLFAGPGTRHLHRCMHLLQPWQAKFFYAEIQIIFGTVAGPLIYM